MPLFDPTSCLYYKTIVYGLFVSDHGLLKNPNESMNNFTGRVNKFRFDKFSTLFSDHNVSDKSFVDKFPKIINHFQWIGKKDPIMKETMLKTFNENQWAEVPEKQKKCHSLTDCKPCKTNHLNFIYACPANSVSQKAAIKKLQQLNSLQDITNTHLNQLDQTYKKTYGTTFTKEVKKQLFPKKQKNERKELAIKIVQNINDQDSSTEMARYMFNYALKLFVSTIFKLQI